MGRASHTVKGKEDVLPKQHRMRTGAEFSHAFRSGIRTGRRNIVVSTAKNPGKTTQVGFIVSKAVGNAVTRNRVKRRLRELAALTCAAHPEGYAIAVRALPAAAQASWEHLRRDYESALEITITKLDRSTASEGEQ